MATEKENKGSVLGQFLGCFLGVLSVVLPQDFSLGRMLFDS